MIGIRCIGFMAMVSIVGCGPQQFVHRNVPTAPDTAVYGYMCLESRNGMETYKDIVLLLSNKSKSANRIRIVFPDGFVITDSEITKADIENHSLSCKTVRDFGEGNFDVIADGELRVVFRSHTVDRISLQMPGKTLSKYAVSYEGVQFSLPIARKELESQIGPPDDIKVDTWADELHESK